MIRKVVYNTCYGDFGLSPLAVKRYYELKYPEKELFFYQEASFYPKDSYFKKVNPEDCHSFDCKIFQKDRGDHFYANLLHPKPGDDFSDSVYLEFYKAERADPILVQVVEELGKKANGDWSELAITEVDGLFRIEEYDGCESVITPNDYDWY